ncbi:membrane protein [Nakamurella panacisegetis]|uniref:Membrane protein n=1 Tax=Nakamurella panacisegetis TaxID=1090615 RepID=A0A1H0P7C7_9ACTN|nr:inner membrane protein YhjD [Nakamurella panacisegetis]SDP00997.1 membrane protein [Nakamurella panacisegetis]
MTTRTDLRGVDLKKESEPAAGMAVRVRQLVVRIKSRKGVRHLTRAAARFGERLGSQFAAAITYFSFLSLVPILMVAFSAAGFVLSSRPDLLAKLQAEVTKQIPGDLSSTISGALDQAVGARFTVGIIGLVLALYSGIGWMGNVRQAVQAQWRPDFDDNQEIAAEGFAKTLFRNLWMLAGLGLALVVSLALSSIGGSLTHTVARLVGLDGQAWFTPVITVAAWVLAIAADVLIFLWVYSVLPPKHMKAPRKALIRGSIIAAAGFEVLKFALTTILPGALSGGATGKVFGPIIGLLAFFNLVATLVLFVAAWISTSEGGPHRAFDDKDEPEVLEPAVVVHEVISKPKLIGFVGVGAILGIGWSRRRR